MPLQRIECPNARKCPGQAHTEGNALILGAHTEYVKTLRGIKKLCERSTHNMAHGLTEPGRGWQSRPMPRKLRIQYPGQSDRQARPIGHLQEREYPAPCGDETNNVRRSGPKPVRAMNKPCYGLTPFGVFSQIRRWYMNYLSLFLIASLVS